MSIKKGDSVKCINCHDGEFTAGSVYVVKAGEGDLDKVCGGIVYADGFIVTDDHGNDDYCVYPSCLYGDWGLV